MALMRYEVTISKGGKVVEKYPAPTKESANNRGKRIARQIGGDLEVKSITPVEYNPADWN